MHNTLLHAGFRIDAEATPAGLLFSHPLRLKDRVPVKRNGQREFAKIALERLAAVVVTGIAGGVGDSFMLVVT